MIEIKSRFTDEVIFRHETIQAERFARQHQELFNEWLTGGAQ